MFLDGRPEAVVPGAWYQVGVYLVVVRASRLLGGRPNFITPGGAQSRSPLFPHKLCFEHDEYGRTMVLMVASVPPR